MDSKYTAIFDLIPYIKEWKDRYWKEGRSEDAKILTNLGNLLIDLEDAK